MTDPRKLAGVAGALLAAGLAVPAGALPAEIVGEPIRRVFDGRQDDLLSAGLGAEGLRAAAPGFADPLAPTALELRRRAVWTAYRGLADPTDGGGFGRMSGPRPGELIAGVEILAAVRRPDGAGITTVVLQVPSRFDRGRPCLVVVASSGSRGIYGALPTAGEWGLRRGCAVAHTDKGTGVGFHDLDTGTVYRIDLVATQDRSDPLVSFAAADSAALAAWRAAHPHRVAVKHLHGGNNPEKDWGQYLLQAARVGLGLLQAEYPVTDGQAPITRAGTTIIASGVSNGGNTVLRAIEADEDYWLDGAVVSEPSVATGQVEKLKVRMGRRPTMRSPGTPLYDYALQHYLLQPAAMLAPSADTPVTAVPAGQRPLWEAWSVLLAGAGLVEGATVEERGADARRRLEAAGVVREALDGGAPNVQYGIWAAVVAGYTSAYSGARVEAAPCGVSYAATDEKFRARALDAGELARLAADGTGVPPTGGVQMVNKDGAFVSLGNFEQALCFRELASGRMLGGEALSGPRAALSTALRSGIEAGRMTAKLRGRPVIIVHGRRDALIPVNHNSRAYLGLHRLSGEDTLRYYEVEHGHHFDAFNALPGWGGHFVPLQPQLLAAMDLMYRRLTLDEDLPPSQVVRSQLRATVDGELEPLEARHLGSILMRPDDDAIRFRRSTLYVPE